MLSRRGAGSTAQQALAWWRRDAWSCVLPHGHRQTAGLAAAAGGGDDAGSGGGGRGKAHSARGNGNNRLLSKICGHFKVGSPAPPVCAVHPAALACCRSTAPLLL